MRKGKFLAGVLSAAMVLGSLTLPENISIGGFDFGTLFAQATDEVASGTCGDNLTWVLDSEGTLTISGTGEMYDYDINGDQAPWYPYNDSLTNAVIEDGVTGIGKEAFNNCSNLATIDIPDSVTSIGRAAFNLCKNLESVHVPYGVTSIAEFSFYACEKLTSINIPDSVISIGENAFGRCTGMETIELSDSLIIIGEEAFVSCKQLESINIPDSLTTIGDYAFYGCASLTSIELPDSLTSIGSQVFGQCEIEIIYSDDCPINGGSVTLYGLDSIYEEYLTIPSDYVDTYQIDDEDMISCSLGCGESVEVSSNGYIELARETWYQGSSFASTAYIEGATVIYALLPGTSYIEVSTSSGVYYFKVEVVDYGEIYTDEVIDSFISENITDDMEDLELMEAICSFPASYDYDASYASAQGMIITGGGDCWASTDLIIQTCEKLGINAWSRNGNNDTGAGSGHMNAIAELNGLYYVLEAGYYEDSPRSYTVTVRTSLFSTRSVAGGLEVYQYDGNEDGAYELVVPEEIDGETVVSIGDECFSYDSNVTKITLPDTVTSIGESAFEYCTSLTEVNIPDGVTSIEAYTFYRCYALTDVTIPDTVTSIAKYAFYYCTSLPELILPDGLVSISEAAISYCTSLTELNIPASVQEIGSYVFAASNALTSFTCDSDSEYFTIENGVLYNKSMTVAYAAPAVVELELVDTVESFITGAFAYNECLIKATIPSSVTAISEAAFWECSNLTTVVLPDTIITIDDAAFRSCTSLTDINFPNSLESIGDSTFADCSSLKNVDLSDGLKSIAHAAFYGCSSLTDVDFPSSLESIGDYAFYMCTSISRVSIPEGVTSVGEMAFAYCTSVTEVSLPSTLTTIDQGVFWDCMGITSVVISEGVETIDVGAFYKCTSLTSLTLPSTVQTIAQGAFESCSSLTSVIIPDTVTEIGQGAFGCVRDYNSSTGSYEDIVIDGFIVYGHPGTTAEEYADEYGFLFIDIDDVQYIEDQTVKIEFTTAQYTGDAIEPTVTIQGLTEGTDYTVSYENNTEIGTATVTVTGIKYYMGTYQTTFSITKADQTVTASIASNSLTVGKTSQITASGIGTITYSSSDTGVAIVSSSGLVTAIGAGTATITIKATGDDYYNSATKTIAVIVEEESSSAITDTSTSTDTSADTETDSGTSTGTSTGADTGTSTDTGASTGTDAGTSTSTNTSTNTGSTTGTDTSADTTTNIGTSADTSSDTNTSSDTDTTADSDIATDLDYTLGDINDDGFVDYLDAMLALRYDAELITFTDEQLLAGDVNRDGSVDSLDAILILRYDAGLIESFS